MSSNFLDFEKPVAELEAKIEALRSISNKDELTDVDLDKEIQLLEKKSSDLTKKIFSNLSSWQISQLARHPDRPYTYDYIKYIFDDFDELSGDRAYADDKAIVAGLARLNNTPVMVIGHQKGRETKDKIERNFGMPSPEGYRKALRLMKLAEKYNIPVITFIDTAGAYPGVGAEERGQSEAIARNLKEMSGLKVPIICNIVGEGGSGGALAIGVGDTTNMLEYSTFSVISPEGAASILFRDSNKAPQAADSMSITAPKLHQLGFINNIIKEPLGGAHRNYEKAALELKEQLARDLLKLKDLNVEQLLEKRYERLLSFGFV
ncbi:acetyl-CoA carboxylase carboxyl transferase subunit alpha [Paraphotobacterium marinum]|uniref:Acetyl-coenzyme A carboxylase carboxyl transferase subunit alpha n=1 Tax=Paraphotobacterium marinum TaxID=1755811 RepID=A0A220VBZ3_9GAMM|nr:acetyl-CoA carboxylase carboxyl transferase subunit alpha [Paraphotobacterium marinum]ASK77810.1 acetyl-CoA carboxylase carboxyl transferase subunit alpha [Paraphotobacterium marinum]